MCVCWGSLVDHAESDKKEMGGESNITTIDAKRRRPNSLFPFGLFYISDRRPYVVCHSPWRSWKIVSLTSPDPAGPAAGLPCPRLNHFVAAPAFFAIFYFSAFYPQLNLSLFVFVIVLGFSLSISLFQLFRPNISHFQSLENCRSTLLN